MKKNEKSNIKLFFLNKILKKFLFKRKSNYKYNKR